MHIPIVVKRVDALKVLEKLMRFRREAELEFRDLAMRFSTPEWRGLFIRFWQQEGRCVAELEMKVREFGGHVKVEPLLREEDPASPDSPEMRDPFLLDKNILMRSINRHAQLAHLYTEALQTPLSFDLRMVLLRQQLQARETQETLNQIYQNYLQKSHVSAQALVFGARGA